MRVRLRKIEQLKSLLRAASPAREKMQPWMLQTPQVIALSFSVSHRLASRWLHNAACARRLDYENVDARRSINPARPVGRRVSPVRESIDRIDPRLSRRVGTRESDESIGIPVCPLDHRRRFPRLFLPSRRAGTADPAPFADTVRSRSQPATFPRPHRGRVSFSFFLFINRDKRVALMDSLLSPMRVSAGMLPEIDMTRLQCDTDCDCGGRLFATIALETRIPSAS